MNLYPSILFSHFRRAYQISFPSISSRISTVDQNCLALRRFSINTITPLSVVFSNEESAKLRVLSLEIFMPDPPEPLQAFVTKTESL